MMHQVMKSQRLSVLCYSGVWIYIQLQGFAKLAVLAHAGRLRLSARWLGGVSKRSRRRPLATYSK
eukprot:4194828-Pleurochrysis_carterae.AAC.1